MTSRSVKNPVALTAALVAPSLGLLAAAIDLFSRRRPSFFAFSFSLALIYSYLPLMWDARNNFFEIFVFRSVELNLYTLGLYVACFTLGIEYMTAIFIYGAIVIYISFKVLYSRILERSDLSGFEYFLCVLLLLMTVEFRAVFDLQKTSLALALFLVGLNAESKRLQYGMYALSAVVHPFTIAILAILPIAHAVRRIHLEIWMLVLVLAFTLAAVMTPERLLDIASDVPIIPARAVYYLGISETRFSSPSVAELVWALRASAAALIAVVCVLQMRKIENTYERWLLNVVSILALLTLLISRNEILAERYFMAVILLSAYAAARIKFNKSALMFIIFAIFANVGLHGVYTLNLAHSDAYNVIGNSQERREISMKGAYFPTLLLLDYGENGYSNEFILARAQVR